MSETTWKVRSVNNNVIILSYKNYEVRLFWAWVNMFNSYVWCYELFKNGKYIYGEGVQNKEKFLAKLSELGLPPLPL